MIGRLVRSVDFEQVLRTPPRARSAHFALHHLQRAPSRPGQGGKSSPPAELSTANVATEPVPVDDVRGAWLGTVVPKRHARRAVTRTLLKRQMRAAAERHGLAAGLWVIRLRAPFERETFASAASEPLRCCSADELALLLSRAAARAPRG